MEPAISAVGSNGRLSFDILGEVFSHYAQHETYSHPLETLLLVCRSWYEAAVGHPRLWGRLRICIGHEPTIRVWSQRLPLRLARAGQSSPLDIDIRNAFSSRDLPDWAGSILKGCKNPETGIKCMCSCPELAPRTIRSLLRILAGDQGELCRRWRTLHVNLDLSMNRWPVIGSISPPQDDAVTIFSLSHPTPKLVSLQLERFWASPTIKILPDVNSIQVLSLRRCYGLTIPTMPQLRRLDVDLGPYMLLLPDLSNLVHSDLIESLSIKMLCTFPDFLPPKLPNLRSLTIAGTALPPCILHLNTPKLVHLSLKLTDPDILETFIQSEIQFWSIEDLEITWPHLTHNNYKHLKEIVVDLLLSILNLSRVEGGRNSLSIIVKLLWEECRTRTRTEWIAGKTFTFYSNEMRRGITINRPERREDLEDVALTLGLVPPNHDWQYLLGRL